MSPDIRLSQWASTFVFVIPAKEDRSNEELQEIFDHLRDGIDVNSKPVALPLDACECYLRERDDDTEYLVIEAQIVVPEELDS